MNSVYLKEVYYRPNKEIAEYTDIFIVTNSRVLKNNITSLDSVDDFDSTKFNLLKELDMYRKKYGNLYIDEVRITYDGNMYMLLTKKIILAIEYVLSSYFSHSVQAFRIIEDIYGSNKIEFDDFKELEVIQIEI